MLTRVLRVVAGLVLVVAGVAMLVLPGPGLVVLSVGIAMVLSQSERGQHLLAHVRVRLRRRFGRSRVKPIEERLPRDVVGRYDTIALDDLAEQVRQRREARGRESRGRDRRGRGGPQQPQQD